MIYIRIFATMNGTKISFYKYHGTGNDFVMIDNRDKIFPKNNAALVNRLCDRRFGIGGDGLILLESDNVADFKMVYYNSDGNQSSMCGNGGRCIVAFAKRLGIIKSETKFIATDGMHQASIVNDTVSLQMKDVLDIKNENEFSFLDTGSPHHIEFRNDIRDINIKLEGAKIRNSEFYGEAGSNVNFVRQEQDGSFSVRTYERGVEDETLSCGTGVTAVAIAAYSRNLITDNEVALNVEGGKLKVSFDENNGEYKNVFLIGPAKFVFEGIISI